MSSRSIRRGEPGGSSGSSSDSLHSSGSGGSSSSKKSTSSRETNSHYDPRISVIRETTADEKRENPGKTLYVLRIDGEWEFVKSIRNLTAYSMNYGESISGGTVSAHFWKAYNTIAYFILDGNIKLVGQKNCFGKLRRPKSGVGSVDAGDGIFIQPTADIETYGRISDGAAGLPPQEVHISSKERDRHGRITNAIVLQKDHKYRVAGEDSSGEDSSGEDSSGEDSSGEDSSGEDSSGYSPPLHELYICHRGRLREAGFEMPGPIHKNDLWLFDRSGKFAATSPITDNMRPCNGCYESMCRREWPAPEMCRRGDNGCNGKTYYIPRMKKRGVKPAVAEYECARLVVRSYYRPGWIPLDARHLKPIKRVLDASFTIRNWDHLAEATDLPINWLIMSFCAVPSLGERLDKRGASFVPWAGDTGLYLGTHVRVEKSFCMRHLYEESDDGVMEILTGEKVRFEKDHNGIVHVERVTEGYSDRVPEGVDGFLCLG